MSYLKDEYRQLSRAILAIANQHFDGEVEPVITALVEALGELRPRKEEAEFTELPF